MCRSPSTVNPDGAENRPSLRPATRYFLFVLAALLASLLTVSSFAAPAGPKEVVAPAIPIAAQAFDLADVRLGGGPFRDAMERDLAYLLRLDPDRLLHTFRFNVGRPSSAQPYGGWEGPEVELRGHSLGHFLSACSLMYRSTGDKELKRRIDYIVTVLTECQADSPKAGFHEGYLSAFPESFFDRVEARQNVWAPWYTLHKIMAGLLDAYRLAGNPQALVTLEKMAGWVKFRVDRLTLEQMQSTLQTEFGGMNEVLANLYATTGEKQYLLLAEAFNHAAVFDPLANGLDALDRLHANTQIPKIIGAAEEFELTGDPRYRKIAETFWDDVVLHRSFVIGGHSDAEHFFPVTEFAQHLTPETAETCNTYNMLKLTRHLFSWQPDGRLMDFYERALYNHILASQDPAQGMFVYLMALEPGSYKTYSTPENSFWCCVGTGMENHAKYGDTIFAHDNRGIFVNLFISAEVSWAERGVRLEQDTRFPNEDTTRLSWHCREPVELALRIRHPSWAAGSVIVTINGQPEPIANEPGRYLELKRLWHDGDRVEARFNLALHTEPLPGVPNTVAVLYGPIVLAGKLGNEDMPSPYAPNQLDQARFPHPDVPAFVASDDQWLNQIEMVSRSPLLFRTRGLTKPREVFLAPFFAVHHERNAVYWKVLSPSAWSEKQDKVTRVEQAWKALSQSALDQVVVGDLESESTHQFHGENTQAGIVSHRGWRQAQHGGFFSYRLNLNGGTPQALLCAYGSRDLYRTFDVYVDDRKIASPRFDGTAPGEILLQQYTLPAEATAGKTSVTIKFQAGPNWDATTANVFGCALVSAEQH